MGSGKDKGGSWKDSEGRGKEDHHNETEQRRSPKAPSGYKTRLAAAPDFHEFVRAPDFGAFSLRKPIGLAFCNRSGVQRASIEHFRLSLGMIRGVAGLEVRMPGRLS